MWMTAVLLGWTVYNLACAWCCALRIDLKVACVVDG